METKLVKLKSDFNDIINIRNTVKNVFDILQVRIDRLHQMHSEFIKTNKSEMFVFGLDSFHFQSKLIDIEYDDMRRLFLAINNRMYCEYFKLHKIIVDYISKNVFDKKVSDLVKINNFPIYKDLEPFKEYKFETILDIHENILNLLGMLMSTLLNKENELSIHKRKQSLGLNIDNFITSFNFNINVMREKIMMFITYIEFFHKMHSKYLKRFSNKIQLMYTHISNDIKFDDSIEMSKNKKKELIDEFVTGNMDKNLLRDLKTSIGSETNSEISCDGSRSSSNSQQGLDLSPIVFPCLVNANNKLNSLGQINTSNIEQLPPVKEKKDYKKIFQRNVHKVTNLLQLCKPKQDVIVNNKATDKEIQEMFNGIEETCDSIINENNEHNLTFEQGNISLDIHSFDKEDINSKNDISIIYNENKEFNIENGENNNEQNSHIMIDTLSIEETKSLHETVHNEQVETLANEEVEQLANEEVETLANEEVQQLANEEVEKVANEKAEQLANEEVEKVANEKAEQLANEEVEKVANEEVEQLANEEVEKVANEEVEQLANEEVEKVANEKAEQLANEEPVKKKRTYNKKKK
jgi:hypothetical protein